MNSIETVAHEFVNDAREVAFSKKDWQDFVDRYGHLRPGTYDITSEAYADNVEKYLRPVVEKVGKQNNQESHDKQTMWLNEKEIFLNH